MELYGSLWKTQEYSISKLGKQEGRQPEVKYKRGRKKLGKREAVRDTKSVASIASVTIHPLFRS